MTTAEYAARAEEHSAQVEKYLREQLSTGLPILHEVCNYALDAGGKRLRPGLTVLSARMFGAPLEDVLPAAAAVEMLHTATLLHDDILDASPMRRGRLTVCRRWSPVVAVVAGDFILSRGFSLLSRYGREDILDSFCEVTNLLCEGEVLQASKRRQLDVTVNDYLEIINCKTAYFLSCCCRIGGMVAYADDSALEALSRYGAHIGLVFQITDDLLDYVGDSTETGKDVGADFREGKYTLPVIMALQSGDEAADRLRALLSSGDESHEAFEAVRSAVVATGAIGRTYELAEKCTQSAVEALNVLPAGEERDAFRRLAQWIASRTT